MSKKSNRLLSFFLVLLAGSALGFLVGAYTGGNFGIGLVADNALRKDALQVDRQLQALRRLRAGENAAAIEILEAGVDDLLVFFDPRDPYPGIDAETGARIDAAIRKVFEYRREFPRRSDRPHLDRMLENLFEKHKLTAQ